MQPQVLQPIAGHVVLDIVDGARGEKEVAWIKSYEDSKVVGPLLDRLHVGGHYRKDLDNICQLPSFFMMLSSKYEHESRKWLGYLGNRKAAQVTLTRGGSTGFLVPYKTGVRCYYIRREDAAPEATVAADPFQPAAPAANGSPPVAPFGTASGVGAHSGAFPGGKSSPFGMAAAGVLGDPFGAAAPAPLPAAAAAPALAATAADPFESAAPVGTPFGNGFAAAAAAHAAHQANGSAAGGALAADQELAARHYNRLERNEEDQAESWLYHLRRFNNWVKSVLIKGPSKVMGASGLRVLDLACGKGGDLSKWVKNRDWKAPGSKYVGVDIARNSLNDAILRLKNTDRMEGVELRLVHADLASLLNNNDLDVWEPARGWHKGPGLTRADVFDVVSMQFALHYMAQSKERMCGLLDVVSRHLRYGGSFIATTVDSRVLVSELLGSAVPATLDLEDPETGEKRSRDVLRVAIDDVDGQNVLTVAFEPDLRERLLRPPSSADAERREAVETRLAAFRRKRKAAQMTGAAGNNSFATFEEGGGVSEEHANGSLTPADGAGGSSSSGHSSDGSGSSSPQEDPWGVRYWFTLREEGQAAVDAPEWLLPMPELCALARERGLELQWPKSLNFHDFFAAYIKTKDHMDDSLDQLKVLSLKGNISEVEWRVAHVYRCLTFVNWQEQSGDAEPFQRAGTEGQSATAAPFTAAAAAAAIVPPPPAAAAMAPPPPGAAYGGSRATPAAGMTAAGSYARPGGARTYGGGGSSYSPPGAPPRSPAEMPPTPSPPLPPGTPSPMSIEPKTPPQPPPPAGPWSPGSFEPPMEQEGPPYCPHTPDHPPPHWNGPPVPAPLGESDAQPMHVPRTPDHPPPGWRSSAAGGVSNSSAAAASAGHQPAALQPVAPEDGSVAQEEEDSSDDEDKPATLAWMALKRELGAAWDALSSDEKNAQVAARKHEFTQ